MLAVNQRSKAKLYTYNKFTYEYKNKEKIVNDDNNDGKKETSQRLTVKTA